MGMTPYFPQDSLLIWVQRLGSDSPSLERCPRSGLGLWGQVVMGQEELNHNPLGYQLEGMLGLS